VVLKVRKLRLERRPPGAPALVLRTARRCRSRVRRAPDAVPASRRPGRLRSPPTRSLRATSRPRRRSRLTAATRWWSGFWRVSSIRPAGGRSSNRVRVATVHAPSRVSAITSPSIHQSRCGHATVHRSRPLHEAPETTIVYGPARATPSAGAASLLRPPIHPTPRSCSTRPARAIANPSTCCSPWPTTSCGAPPISGWAGDVRARR
jgi:hypothetical protein